VREPRRAGLLHYDLQSPRVYDHVTFYNAAYFDPRVPNFILFSLGWAAKATNVTNFM
jgi:hypothetical protein